LLLCEAFPRSAHQSVQTHLVRNIEEAYPFASSALR
jgi:hypothetical protein